MSAGGSAVKNPPAIREMHVWSLGWEDPLEKEMATDSSSLAWEISWTEEPGGLRHDRGTKPPHVEKYLMTSVEEKKPDMNEKRRVPCM